jgi:CubicO group peptidase (beta-lactamase class C family)
MMRAPLPVAICLFLLSPVPPQQDLAARVDAFVQAEMKKQNIPGVSLAVVTNGQPPLIRSYGLANIEHQVPVKPETIFQSGSVGKQFTSALVMLLVEDGKLSVDDKVSKYLGPVPDAWSNLTVRHLLTHTGGLTDYPKGFDFRRDYTEDELLKVIQAVPLAFQPGEKHAYSNLGYVTLGILISKAAGKFYGDLLQERIFKPLDMTTARIINEADIVPHRAAGYRLVQGQLKNQNWVSPTINTTADGSLYLSVLDMIKWDAALRSTTFLKPSSRDAMWTPLTLSNGQRHPYGFGWSIGTRAGRRFMDHGGAWQGFVSYITRYPDDGLTVIVLVNRAGGQASALANGVAAIANPDLAEKPLSDTEPAMTSAHRKLLEDFIAGNAIDKSLFTPQVVSEVLPRIEASRAEIKGLGAITAIELLERATKDGVRLNRYRVRFQKANGILTVVLDKDGKIAGLGLRPE